MNSMFTFQNPRSLNAFPSRCELNENPFLVDAERFVGFDKLDGLLDAGIAIKRQTSIDFCRNTSRNDVEDFLAEQNEELIGRFRNLSINGAKK